MNRYEAIITQLKEDGTTNLKETWIICLKCLDSWLGKPGDKCCVCKGESKPIPLANAN